MQNAIPDSCLELTVPVSLGCETIEVRIRRITAQNCWQLADRHIVVRFRTGNKLHLCVHPFVTFTRGKWYICQNQSVSHSTSRPVFPVKFYNPETDRALLAQW